MATSPTAVSPIDPQYGLPRREVELLRQQATLRAERRHEFIKQTTNPYRHASGEGGYLFDPAIQRMISTKVSQYDYFKAAPKTSLYLAVTLIPMVGMMYIVKKERSTREHTFRTGQVAYRDRLFKFV